MGRFLWKPISEKNGALVVLADGANQVFLKDMNTGETIEHGINAGASNGYGGTFRFTKTGNAYRNVAVVDEMGRVLQEISDGSGRQQGIAGLGNMFSPKQETTTSPVQTLAKAII